jgi:hypothetical protein
MVFLSKGILKWKSDTDSVSVIHCGETHTLSGIQAEMWLSGQYQPFNTKTAEQDDAVMAISDIGLAECGNEGNEVALFRLLINCVICPNRVIQNLISFNKQERRLWRWIRFAGLRLTMAELTLLTERRIKPISKLLYEENRQELTELIYTSKTIGDGILETLMEHSSARDVMVYIVLGLLRKKKIYLI